MGWSALLIEKNPKQIQDLLNNACENSTVVFGEITDLDSQLLIAEAPVDLDFVSIDVDGQDYWLWHDMVKYRPRIMCIEYNPYHKSPDWHPTRIVKRGTEGGFKQTARQPIEELAEEKGYELVDETFCNLIFVDKNELYGK